jgi:aerobic-type carbon monoxide dehydrogenase small subunit (CoxS/CutS family)
LGKLDTDFTIDEVREKAMGMCRCAGYDEIPM